MKFYSKARVWLFCSLLFIFILIFSSTALASGWWMDSTSDTVPASGTVWNNLSENMAYGTPHGGYVDSSNLCKTCHAVHGGGANSYRLLKNGTTDATRTQGELNGVNGPVQNGMGSKRSTECMYCHDASSGATLKKPYLLGAISPVKVLGEHSLGATRTPDSNINGGSGNIGNLIDRNPLIYGGNGAELDCYQCHSVHGANTIGFDYNNDGALDAIALNNKKYNSQDSIESWNNKILRVDPSGDGIPLGEDATGGITATDTASEPTAVRTGFCGDCHNRNPNWVSTTDTVGPNKTSHIQGPGADGLMEVYGQTKIAVAAHTSESQGCRGCHAASDGSSIRGIDPGNLTKTSNFPHQSLGWKLMWDAYTNGTSTVAENLRAADPNRSLPSMDRVCLMCHPVDDEFETGKGYADASTEEKLCFRCHNLTGYANNLNVKDQFAKNFTHPTSTTAGRHKSGTTETAAQLGTANRHAECLDCHNMDTVVQGQRQPLRGIWGVSVTNGAAGTEPTYTVTSAVTTEFELCFKCHSSYVSQPTTSTFSGPAIYEYPVGTDLGQEDKALAYNPNNNAFHPVEGPGRNVSSNLNDQLIAAGLPDGVSTVIKCTDCHNSDDTSDTVGLARNDSSKPQGAHGSNSRPLLRANYILKTTGSAVSPSSWDSNNFKLCFLCHDETALMAKNIAVGAKTNFYKDSTLNRNLHWVHLKDLVNRPAIGPNKWDENAVCRDCHYNTHSNQEAAHTAYGYESGTGSYTWTTGLATPPDGVKTHLVNFAPELEDAGGGGKPNWVINLSTDNSVIPIGGRACQLRCHLNKGGSASSKDMDLSTHYYDPLSGDDVPTY